MYDREQTRIERRRALMRRFLATIEGDAWQGTPTEVAESLFCLAEYHEEAPANPSLFLKDLEAYIGTLGWRMTIGRTAKARYVRFERAS